MTTSDEALALAAAGGDGRAFAALLDRHYDRLFAFAFRLCGRREEAEDLTQDICLKLPAKMRSFRGDAKFTTWLYRVAVNAAHDRRRRAASYAKASEGWGDWEIARQAAMAEDRERIDWLGTAMAGLKPDLRDTAVLVLGEEMTQGEAAQVLGISEGTVAWRMSEVKKALRKIARAEAS